MESMKEESKPGVETRTSATNDTSNTPAHFEADSMSALQSTYKGSVPSDCEIAPHSGHASHTQPLRSGKTSTCNEMWSCDGGKSVDSIERQPTLIGRRQFRSIWIPYVAVLLPTLALPAVLAGLVFSYQIDPGTNIFPLLNETTTQPRGYYLVAFSVTRLAIISSCASTLGPFLSAPILILWRIHTIRSAKKIVGRQANGRLELTTIPHFTTLLGLLVGSLDDLLKYLLQICTSLLPGRAHKKHNSSMWRPVHLAALVAISCIAITLSMWTADTVFHTLSYSVNVEKFDPANSLQSYGYGVTKRCQTFDRSKNECLPCTWDLSNDLSWLEFCARANEIFRLSVNVSEDSQIQTMTAGLSVLLPNNVRISNQTDYRALTYGVTAKCQPLPEVCNMRTMDTHTYTMFNCSKDFRGIIGEAPVVPTTQNFTVLDPDTPPLNFKPSTYLQYGFYESSNFSTPYNSVGYNVNIPGWAVSAGAASTTCPSDNTLPSTVHMGVAGRFAVTSAKAGVDLSNDPGLFSTSIYSDFVFHCALEAHEIEYVWASGAIRNYTMKPADASVLNMYIGQLPYYTQAASDDMTDDILQMALQPDSQSMADTWARLFSVRVLSVIGGYTEPIGNLEQQTRVPVLVARVHIGSMWFLVGCSLGTSLFVSWIALRGLYLVSEDPAIGEEAAILTYEGQLNHHLGNKKDLSSGKQDTSEKVNVIASQEPSAPLPPGRSFTGNSSATTVVPTDTETAAGEAYEG